MVQIFQTLRLMDFGNRLDLFYRTRYSFMGQFTIILPMEGLKQRLKKLLKLLNWPMLMSLLQRCHMDMIPWSEKEELHFQAASGNVLVLPAQWYAIHPFLFWMNQLHLSILNLKKLLWKHLRNL